MAHTGFFVDVNSINGSWISNVTRFSYDAFCFLPSASAIPCTFKLPFCGSVFLGSDLSLVDLLAITFYFDALRADTLIFSTLPFIDNSRSFFWGFNVRSVKNGFCSFDFILLVGAVLKEVAPSLFAIVREAFCSGTTVASFGSVCGDFMVTSCGNRFSDFLRFVLGYHMCCTSFSKATKTQISSYGQT